MTPRTTTAATLTLAGLLVACSSSTTPPAAGPASPTSTAPSPEPSGKPPAGPEPAPGATGPLTPMASGPFQPATKAELAQLVSSNNHFGTDLYAKLRTRDGNLAFSPASISLALAMTYAGARDKTAQQMHDTLRFSQPGDTVHRGFGSLLRAWAPRKDQPYELRVANRLFGEQTMAFHDPFLAVTSDHYQAPLERLNFKGAPEDGRTRINTWVAKQTEDKIVNLLPSGSIKNDTRLVLTNAIYFLGTWAKPFVERNTRNETFHAPGGDRQVKMMHTQDHFDYAEVDGLQVLTMPYKGGHLAMSVLLPTAQDGLAQLESKMTASALQRWLKSTRQYKVDVSFPRFEIDPPDSIALKPTLSAMGMPIAFDRDYADFRHVAQPTPPDVNFALSDVFHKAFVKVDEKGTEAAAATAVVVIGATSAMPVEQPEVFRADHPFVFVIRDTRNGSLLFMGRVQAP